MMTQTNEKEFTLEGVAVAQLLVYEGIPVAHLTKGVYLVATKLSY